jgi:pSer/pThr/pTyr-binding forkhead associated (FHA) protein
MLAVKTEAFGIPPWAYDPKANDLWKLIEIKNGIEVDCHELLSACIITGRSPADPMNYQNNHENHEKSVNVIVLAHESCSRRHARIAFDTDGCPWLRDLESTHGTMVNKRRLPAQAIGKLESNSTTLGSRGVRLFPGDVLQFGASSRFYLLEGPSHFERGARKALEQQQKILQHEQQSTESSHQSNLPVSNVVDTHNDDYDDEHDDEPFKALDESMIPPQHIKTWESLQAKRYKQQNLLTENDRIEAKGELTDGQQRQLERNLSRLQVLQEDIEIMEQELWRTINPSKPKGGPRSLFLAATDDDDVDDRTNSSSHRPLKAETEESLIAQWKQYHVEFQSCESAMNRYHQQIQDLMTRQASSEASVDNDSDDEEKFYRQNEITLLQELFDKYRTRREDILLAVKDVEQLLPFVNPKLVYDWKSGQIGTTHSSTSPSKSLPPVPSITPQSSEKAMSPPKPMQPPSQEMIKSSPSSRDSMTMPPPHPSQRTMIPSSSHDSMIMPPPQPSQKTRVPSPSKDSTIMPPPLPIQSSSQEKMMSSQHGIVMPPPSGKSILHSKYSIIHTPEQPSQQQPKRQRLVGPMLPPGVPKSSSKENHLTELNCDAWTPPIDQDGSGRTKNNDRFQGRY